MDPQEVQKRWGGIDGALATIGRGIGVAANAIVTGSSGPVGTLAVKTVDVVVEFELAAASTLDSMKGPGFGEVVFRAPLFAVGQETAHASNKASITFKVVAVAALTAPAANGKLPEGWPWNTWSLGKVEDTLKVTDALINRIAGSVDDLARIKAKRDSGGRMSKAEVDLAGEINGLAVGASGAIAALLKDAAASPGKGGNHPGGEALVQQLQLAYVGFKSADDATALAFDPEFASTLRSAQAWLHGLVVGARG